MESEVLKAALTNGAFAALFVWLFIDTRKESKEREKGYQDTIKENQTIIKENQTIITNLTTKLNVVETVKEDVEDIKEYLFK